MKIKRPNPSQEPPVSSKSIWKEKIGTWVYQRLMTISKSRSRCQPQSATSRVPKINLEGKNWNMSVSETSYPDFGTWQDSKLL